MAILQFAGTMPIADAAAIISVLAFVNILLVIRHSLSEVDWSLFRRIVTGQIPAIIVGLWLLHLLSAGTRSILALIFAVFLIGGSLTMVVRPKLREQKSRSWSAYVFGFGGGILGGLFSASGPVSGWYAYSQPIAVATARATMLAILFVTSSFRTVLVAIEGGYKQDLLVLILIGLPVIVLMSWISNTFPITAGDTTLRRWIFSLLLLIGVWIAGAAVYQLVSAPV